MVTAFHRVIVLVWGGRDGRSEGGRGRGRGRGRGGRGVTGAGGVALGGSVVLGVGVVYEGNMGLRVLYPEFGVGHEVVDGRSRLGLLQPLIEGDGAAECIHHPDLEERRGDRRWKRRLVRLGTDTRLLSISTGDTTEKKRFIIGSITGKFERQRIISEGAKLRNTCR